MILGCREEYLIEKSRNIEEEKSYEWVVDLFSLGLDAFLILGEHDHIDADHHEIDERESWDEDLCKSENLESEIIDCCDRVSRSYASYSYRDILDDIRIIRELCENSRYTSNREEQEDEKKENLSELHDRYHNGKSIWIKIKQRLYYF